MGAGFSCASGRLAIGPLACPGPMLPSATSALHPPHTRPAAPRVKPPLPPPYTLNLRPIHPPLPDSRSSPLTSSPPHPSDSRSAGLLDSPSTLVAISPMRRTLQTAVALFGSNAWTTPTVVQPLAAETSLASRFSAPGIAKRIVANVQQGDHGSTPDGLRLMFPVEQHPQLDFTPVGQYCGSMGSRWAAGGAEEGRWWHHGNDIGYESCHAEAEARAAALRRWLALEAVARRVSTILLVSHGGILKLAFRTRPFANAEFRCFELSEHGEIVGEAAAPADSSTSLPLAAMTDNALSLLETVLAGDAPISLLSLEAAADEDAPPPPEVVLAEESPLSQQTPGHLP